MTEAARGAEGSHIPDRKDVVKEIAADMADRPERGKVASYIPELAKVDPKKFGIVIVGNDGEITSAGDSDVPPYRTGLEALLDGWRVVQFPQLNPPYPNMEYTTSFQMYEFIFEQLVDVA